MVFICFGGGWPDASEGGGGGGGSEGTAKGGEGQRQRESEAGRQKWWGRRSTRGRGEHSGAVAGSPRMPRTCQ